MNAAIVRRLSFGSSKRAFPMDKYLSALNNPEYSSEILSAYDSWTAADLDEANKVEIKRDALQREVSELEAQYKDLLIKKKFLAALRAMPNVESLPRDDENSNSIARNTKQVKEQRKQLEKENKESTQELYKDISKMIAQHEIVKNHRDRLEKQLQEVKSELAETAQEDKDRDSATSLFAMMTDDSMDSNGSGPNAATPSPFFGVNQVISAYSGVQIGEFGDDRISFHLAVTAGEKTHHFTLSVDFEPFNNCAIRNVTVSPEFPPLEPVFARAREEDTQFLITESILRIRNVLEVRREVEALSRLVPSVSWRENDNVVHLAREFVQASITLPYDYPTFDTPKLLELLVDGQAKNERKVEINAMKLPTLTAFANAIFQLDNSQSDK